jgi:hypothetical protein
MPKSPKSKILYLSVDASAIVPDLTSKHLEDLIYRVGDWTQHLKFKPSIKQYLFDHPEIERALKSLKVI